MHILDLNLDVVHTMLSYVERKDMLPLATTCTSLYEPVMQHRLAHINTGSFTKREDLREYCDYMLCDARRPRYLTSVVISRWPEASAGDNDNHREAELFAQVIRQTARLATVKCCMQLDESQTAPFLLDAITSITTLTSIELALHDDDMLYVLSSLRSDPYRLGCCFWSPRQGVELGVPIPRLLDQLTAFSHLHTLELELADASFFPLERGTPDEVKTLPSVRELTLVQPAPLNLHLAARVFPSVETLYLSQPPDTNEPQVPFAWPSVDYLSTNCAVAVTSHVRHVSVAASPRCTQSSIAMLHRLLPSVIECNVDRAYLQAVALLPQPVRFLQLRIAANLNEGLQQYLVSTVLPSRLYQRLTSRSSTTTWKF